MQFQPCLGPLPCPPSPQSALRLKPYFTDAYNNMASALVHKGLIPAAMDCYVSALRINPGLVRAGGCVRVWGVRRCTRWLQAAAACSVAALCLGLDAFLGAL